MESDTKPSLLLVEDNLSTQAALSRLFRNHFDVTAVSNPKVALEHLQKGLVPAIIFSDYMMPEMSGLQFLQEAMLISPTSMRIVLTGHLEAEELNLAMQNNILHRVLMKPWENDLLLFQMREVLKLHEIFKEKYRLEMLAITDAVTGLFNRRHFQNCIQIEVDRALRYKISLALILIDVDFFKSVNDSQGHSQGDLVLREVAQIIKIGVRNIDIVCRYGGDEFAIILPQTEHTGAREVAERIRLACNKTKFPVSSDITLSLGVSTLSGKITETRLLIESADQALYQAKRNGKNQTIIAGTSNFS